MAKTENNYTNITSFVKYFSSGWLFFFPMLTMCYPQPSFPRMREAADASEPNVKRTKPTDLLLIFDPLTSIA